MMKTGIMQDKTNQKELGVELMRELCVPLTNFIGVNIKKIINKKRGRR